MTNSWTGNWRGRIAEGLTRLGFDSILDYARTRELSSCHEMARELGATGIAPVQMELLLLEEAQRANCVDYYIRSTLVRELNYFVPKGIRMYDRFQLAQAMAAWGGAILPAGKLDFDISTVIKTLRDDTSIPDDWVPSGPDDPILLAVFAKAAKP